MQRQVGIQMQHERDHVARRQRRGRHRVAQHPQVAHCRREYTAADADRCRGPRDREPAAVERLQRPRAGRPAIAATAAPGQFVMLQAGTGQRPAAAPSVFRCSRSCATPAARPTGITILSKRIGVSTALLYDAREGQRIDCLGPLGRPFTVVDPPSAGVDDRRRRRPRAIRDAGAGAARARRRDDACSTARAAPRSSSISISSARSASSWC